jgi:hypothetical protein
MKYQKELDAGKKLPAIKGRSRRNVDKQEDSNKNLVEKLDFSFNSIQSCPNPSSNSNALPTCETPPTYKIPLKDYAHGTRTWPHRRVNSIDEIPFHDDEQAAATRKSLELDFLRPPGLRQRKAFRRSQSAKPNQMDFSKHSKRPPVRKSRWLIPAEHPFKVLWDVVTIVFSIAYSYATHVAIRDRKFGASPFLTFCDMWFLVDIVLNFVTERKIADGVFLRDHRSICARYLTTWFAIDALSLFPWESLYVQPIIAMQNRRGFFRKNFFRSRAALRVTSNLRGHHFRWFGKVARHTKQHGVGASRLLRLIIKYTPKYLLFFRNMKGVVAFRLLRQVHWCRRFCKNMSLEKDEAATSSLTREDMDFYEDDVSSHLSFGDSNPVQVVYENWELMDDDDDGVPL